MLLPDKRWVLSSFSHSFILSRSVFLNSIRPRRYSHRKPSRRVPAHRAVTSSAQVSVRATDKSPAFFSRIATVTRLPLPYEQTGDSPGLRKIHEQKTFTFRIKQRDHRLRWPPCTYLATSYFPRTLRSKYHRPWRS